MRLSLTRMSKVNLDLLLYYFITFTIIFDMSIHPFWISIKLSIIGVIILLYIFYQKVKVNILLLYVAGFAILSSVNYIQFYSPGYMFIGAIIYNWIYFFVFLLILIFIEQLTQNVLPRKHLAITVSLYYIALVVEYNFLNYVDSVDMFRHIIVKTQLGTLVVLYLLITEKTRSLKIFYTVILLGIIYSLSLYQIRSNILAVVLFFGFFILYNYLEKPVKALMYSASILLGFGILYIIYNESINEFINGLFWRFSPLVIGDFSSIDSRLERYMELFQQLGYSYIPYALGNGLGMASWLSTETKLSSPHSALIGMIHQVGLIGSLLFVIYYLKKVLQALKSEKKEIFFAGAVILSSFILSISNDLLFPTIDNFIFFKHMIIYLLLLAIIKDTIRSKREL